MIESVFLVYFALSVTDLTATSFEQLSSIDYDELDIQVPNEKPGKLGIHLLTENAKLQPKQFPEKMLHRLPNEVANQEIAAQDSDDFEYKDVEVGSIDDEELNRATEEVIRRAEKKLSEQFYDELRKTAWTAEDDFCIHLRADPPVEVPAKVIEAE